MTSLPPDRDRDRPRLRARHILLAFLVSSGWLVVNLLPVKGVPLPPDDAPGFDAHIYLAMAESPSVFTMAPFAYRIAVPALAHLLGLRPELSFLVLTATGLIATLTLAYVFLRQLGFGHGLALLGVSFIGAAPEVSVYLKNHFLVDPLALALLTALLIAIERQAPSGPTALLLLVASLCKESAFYAVPVLYLSLSGGKLIDGRAARRALWISLPAVAAALFLRLGWGGEMAGFPYRTPWSVPRQPWFGTIEAYDRLWSGLFGYLSLLALANAFTESWRGFACRYSPYIALVVAQLLLPLNSERLLFFGFPFVIPLALVEIERLEKDIPDWFPLIASLLFFSYLFEPTRVVSPLALVVLGRLLIEWRRRQGARS